MQYFLQGIEPANIYQVEAIQEKQFSKQNVCKNIVVAVMSLNTRSSPILIIYYSEPEHHKDKIQSIGISQVYIRSYANNSAEKCHHSLQHGNFLSLITVQLVISKETYTEVVSTSLGITLLSRTLISCYGVGTMIILMRAKFVSKVDCALTCFTYLIACISNQNRTMSGLFMFYKN